MKRKIDPTLADVLRKYGADPETDIWDCHGTWVAYHRTCERIAAKAGVKFDTPQVIEASAASGTVTVLVTGRMDDRAEWSFGEASPKNNKNAYPYAMAEKRAKDRVILKLVGLAGVYSEEEAEEFSKDRPINASTDGAEANGTGDTLTRLTVELTSIKTIDNFGEWLKERDAEMKKLSLADYDTLKARLRLVRSGLLKKEGAAPSTLMAG